MSSHQVLAGFHAVVARLRHAPGSIKELYVEASRRDKRMQTFIEQAQAANIRVRPVPADRLDGLAQGTRHQGVVALAEPITEQGLPASLFGSCGGGELWLDRIAVWETTLADYDGAGVVTIRQPVDVFVLALSNNGLASKPCRAELAYARDLGIHPAPLGAGVVRALEGGLGPDHGVGSTYHWSGNKKAGEGEMRITGSTPTSLVADLEFLKPFKCTNAAEFSFTPAGSDTVAEVDYLLHVPLFPDEAYTVRDSISRSDDGAAYRVDWAMVRARSTKAIVGSAHFQPHRNSRTGVAGSSSTSPVRSTGAAPPPERRRSARSRAVSSVKSKGLVR